ncbi:LANO_0E12464g1_1 [Lachancea nothofagi CBS 11611]|uniref:diacylglycerol cholinephosphotransferase n=1 Tax=Lachancea nothofagi CBS 11611 TaxID=1266666 RepID=A0A1G4JY52_9SACH|nr:LANO_0E12464g1_1 [Lachancea nothofagi CBS 11611]
MGIFIPHSKLENLSAYKYQSEDRSLVTKYVLKPFWVRFVKIFPLWMAPNLVTLSGLGFIILNVLTVLYYDPTLSEESPRWTYFTYAIGLFLYQTFDACDGQHARRTGQSGPLGELFDHCIDSLNTTLSMMVFCSAIGSGMKFMTVLSQFALLCNFYLSTWEEYHTHKLFLSEFSGPVEGILMIVGAFILTGIFGPHVLWHKLIGEFKLGNNLFRVESIHVVYALCSVGLAFNILSSRRNVVEHYEKNSQNTKDAQSKVKVATLGLAPFFTYFATIFVLVTIDPEIISLPFILSVGLTIAFTVGRIIVCHLTMQSFPMINPPMLIPLLQFLLKTLLVRVLKYERLTVLPALNWFGFGLALGIHAMFVTEVIYEFTSFLDIYALSIKHPKKSA